MSAPEPIRVLILEDNPSDASLMVDALVQAGFDPRWERCDSEAEFAARLTPELDLILSDFALPQFSGLQALRLVRSRGLDVPFILVSGNIGEEIAIEAIRTGADDYLLKDRMARLGPAVRQVGEKRRLRVDMERAETALRESEAKYRELIEQASDGIFVNDQQGRILLANSRYCEMLGYTSDELLQLNVADTYPDEERADFLTRLPQLSTVKHRLFERRMRRKDGTCFPVEISVQFTAHGTHQGIVRDITERKNQEDRIARLNRIYAVLSSINSAIVRVRELQGLFEEACRIAVEHGGFGIAWIGMLDPLTLDITPVAWAGLDVAEYLGTVKSSARIDHPFGQGVVGRAVRERKAIFSNDLLAEQSSIGFRAREAIRRGYRSRIAMPLLMDKTIVGVMVLFAREKDFFTDEELKLLAELAGNISFAMEHIASQQKIEKLSRVRSVSSEINAAIVRSRSRQELFDEACRIAVEHGKFGIVWIGELDAVKLEVVPVASAGLEDSSFLLHTILSVRPDGVHGQGVLPRAVRERRPVYSNDITVDVDIGGERRKEAVRRGYRSVIVLPLIVDGAVAGTLSMFAKELNFFDNEEVQLLAELAGNISFAMESLARQEKLERLSRIRSVLGDINAAIVRLRNRQELFDEACRIAVEQCGFPMAWIGMLDPASQDLKRAAMAGSVPEYANRLNPSVRGDIPAGQGTNGRAFREKRPIVDNDMTLNPNVGSMRAEGFKHGIRAALSLPLLVEEEAVGVMGLYATETDYFDDEEVSLLTELAGNISFALQTLEKQEKLDYLAYYDALTGLPNRSLFIDRAGQQLRARGGEAPMVAVVLLNLDRFRNINETFGRHGGDELLKLVAQRLESAFNGRDYLARTAPDGFGVVMRGMRDAAVVAHCVESQVLECFRQPFVLNEAEIRVSARAGIAMFPADGGDADILFKNAEAALKKAKDTGERYLFYAAEMNARAALVLSLETRLRKAVELQQFVLHYQPKIHLASGAICGMEALIRWQEPGTGLVAPGIFIPVLEETGLILEAGKWVIEQALADHRAWTARGCRAPRIAVNVSAIQLQQRDFAEMVIEAVQQGGNVPAALEIEVTESLLMKDIEASIRKLSLLRGLGIHIAMDDFGTGYSSLSYIARLPINSVKIDRSFINGMGASDQDMAIVTTIVTLAHSLNLRVVAEGVETEAQSRLLMLLKCDEAQGYLFSRPVPAAEIEPLLRAPREEPASHRATRERTARSAPPSPRTSSAPQRVARPSIPATPRKKRHHKT